MRLRLPNWLTAALIRRAMRTPYAHIGDYMERYWLVPYRDAKRSDEPIPGCGPVSFWRRPLAWLIQRFGIAVRIHHIKRSDDDRAFHDHPWWYVTVILRGGYHEVTPVFASGMYECNKSSYCSAGTVLFRRATSWHRLEIDNLWGEPTWTLFITGPKTNSWGFLVEPNHKIYWREYLKERGAKQ